MGQMALGPSCPPDQGQHVPDDAEGDEEDDYDLQLPRPDKTETKNKRHLDLLKILSKILPDKFKFVNRNIQRDLDDLEASRQTQSSQIPEIIRPPILNRKFQGVSLQLSNIQN